MSKLTNRLSSRARKLPGKQRGAMTMFSAVLILILLTELVLYATQVGVFEQRKSANDLRQKQAFHAAESGLQNAREFFLANVSLLSYPGENGWLATAGSTQRWTACGEADFGNANHPCSGEAFPEGAAQRASIEAGTYYYNFADPLNPQVDDTLLPLLTGAADPDIVDRLAQLGERVEVQALLCVLDINRDAVPPAPAVRGCVPHGAAVEGEHIYFMLTLLAKGQAACANPADPATCEAEALIAEKLGSFGPASGNGGPGVPLTARGTVPPGGTAELVPNPNGGGPGVPISAWINGRNGVEFPLCAGDLVPFDPSSGSWSTCERHEWYGVDQMTEDYACPTPPCSCGSDERRLSYAEGGEQIVGIDIVVDPLFPCDLFKATFGMEKTAANFNELKASVGVEIDTCEVLGPESAGVYWMTGDECSIEGGTVVGSAEFPVFLISVVPTKIGGGSSLFGVLFVTDVPGVPPGGEFTVSSNATVYGAVVVDAEIAKFNGTFQIVYVDVIARLASQSGGIGQVSGGWTDFHPVWQGRAES